MKTIYALSALFALTFTALGADVKFSALPTASSPSTNSYLPIIDLDLAPANQNAKYLLTNLATVAYVTPSPATVAYSSSIAVDFSTQQSIWTVLNGDLTISSSNLAPGKRVLYRIDNGTATNCNVILPSGWRKVSGTVTNILSTGSVGWLYSMSYTSNDTNVVCQWSSE